MATVVFYEKPGCAGNAWQKSLLEASGHTVVARDILHTDWRRLQLLPFLKSLPISQWFNRNAPLIQSGAINPEAFDAADVTTVLDLLVEHPLLIRRPLLDVDGICQAGFDIRTIHAWIGLSAAFDGAPVIGNPEVCRHGANGTTCPVRE
ncbi:ArsC/Spx/MgsR family protein [Propionivibrio dicarboxylicus]|uniref:Nitrogenase-associated protein n=1 Tax=Propionivibrio dicarboxylicus TaxID=83767 RepID=A0A1G7VEP6_9RHOO|nr:ArsC/Spx/MgsR family protein [Propionivibrio dicarboxylicus]SDG58312.1 nitrogenase-associated protein [Propionivibrio dicarboxylicus]